jgi:hypothetical protein
LRCNVSTEPRPTRPRRQIGIRTVSLAQLDGPDRTYQLASCTSEHLKHIGIVHNPGETERLVRVDQGPERTVARRSVAGVHCSVAAARRSLAAARCSVAAVRCSVSPARCCVAAARCSVAAARHSVAAARCSVALAT